MAAAAASAEAGHEKHDEAQRLRRERSADTPLEACDMIALELERARREHHTQQAEAQRNLVGHELGTAPAGRRGSRICCCSPSRRSTP